MNKHLQLLTLGQLGIALLTIFRAQAASLWALALCAIVVLGTTFLAKHFRVAALESKRLRTFVVALVVGAFVLRGYRSAELISPGVDLVLMLIVERCLFRERLREQIQLLLLGSMLIVIAGVVHVGPDYPLLMAAFVMTAMAHLGLWNLERQAERIGARAQFALAKHARVFTRQLVVQNLRLGLGVMATALIVFLFFPRIGAGVFFRGNRASSAQAGFSDEVSLGHRGDISNNPKIVARVYPEKPKDREKSTLDLYFRVSAFDHYKDGRWSHSLKIGKTRLRSSMYRYYLPFGEVKKDRAFGYLQTGADGETRLNSIPGWGRSSELVQLKILQNDLGTRHLMVPSPGALVEWLPRGALERSTRLSGEKDGQIKAIGPASGSMRFRVFARRHQPSGSELRNVGRPRHAPGLEPYLRLPQTLSPDFYEYSRSLAEDSQATTQYDLLVQLISSLAQFRYTTRSQTPSAPFVQRDPIEAFLLDSKAGHCEYFASALALLARSHGMPARVVNGYYGAHQNPVDGTFQIAQSQAHAWVEVYFSKLGWVRFDATPQQERLLVPKQNSWLLRARNLFQALETKYLEYIVDYDGKKQWNAVKGLGRSSTSLSRKRLGLLLGGLVLGVALLMLWRRWPFKGSQQDQILVAQLRLRDRLVQQGLKIAAQENALSWARKAREAGMDPTGQMGEIIQASEVIRFAKAPVPLAQFQEVLDRLKGLEPSGDAR